MDEFDHPSIFAHVRPEQRKTSRHRLRGEAVSPTSGLQDDARPLERGRECERALALAVRGRLKKDDSDAVSLPHHGINVRALPPLSFSRRETGGKEAGRRLTERRARSFFARFRQVALTRRRGTPTLLLSQQRLFGCSVRGRREGDNARGNKNKKSEKKNLPERRR